MTFKEFVEHLGDTIWTTMKKETFEFGDPLKSLKRFSTNKLQNIWIVSSSLFWLDVVEILQKIWVAEVFCYRQVAKPLNSHMTSFDLWL